MKTIDLFNILIDVDTDVMGLCDDPNFIKLLLLVKIIIYLLMIGAAAALIVRSILVLIKEITSEKAEVDKAIKTVGSKIILACILFLLPAIFNWVFFSGDFFENSNSDMAKCIKHMADENWLENADNPYKDMGYTIPDPSSTGTGTGTSEGGGSYGSHESEAGYSHGGGGNRR